MKENVEAKPSSLDQSRPGKPHFLDLKLPIGGLLSAYGLLLGVYGLVTRREMYQKSLGLNLNLTWGVLMLVIGAGFLLASFLGKREKKG